MLSEFGAQAIQHHLIFDLKIDFQNRKFDYFPYSIVGLWIRAGFSYPWSGNTNKFELERNWNLYNPELSRSDTISDTKESYTLSNSTHFLSVIVSFGIAIHLFPDKHMDT